MRNEGSNVGIWARRAIDGLGRIIGQVEQFKRVAGSQFFIFERTHSLWTLRCHLPLYEVTYPCSRNKMPRVADQRSWSVVISKTLRADRSVESFGGSLIAVHYTHVDKRDSRVAWKESAEDIEEGIMSWIAAKPEPSDGRPITSVGYIGTLPSGEVRPPDYSAVDPQAFHVHMRPESAPLRTHFHAVDQFQFVTGGAGRMANHAITAGSVHYADRNTPYGPIVAGETGVSYLTLRGVSSAGAFYMPESRDGLATALAGDPGDRPATARRNLSVELGVELNGGHSRWRDEHCDPDGLRIAIGEVGGDDALVVSPITGDGAYLVVLAGAVTAEDTTQMTAGAVRWCPPGFDGSLVSEQGGARIALLQLPERPTV